MVVSRGIAILLQRVTCVRIVFLLCVRVSAASDTPGCSRNDSTEMHPIQENGPPPQGASVGKVSNKHAKTFTPLAFLYEGQAGFGYSMVACTWVDG
jgi:hypothetical protein